jgi:hypothetical protein
MSILVSLILFSLYGNTHSQTAAPEVLEGRWQVDLRPTPEAASYFKVLEIKVKGNNQLSGRFYGSKFKKGVVNTDWPQLHFAFSTQDRNNTYFHTGYLDGDILRGQTYCPERSFIAPWTATRLNETKER